MNDISGWLRRVAETHNENDARPYIKAADTIDQLRAENEELRADRDARMKGIQAALSRQKEGNER